MCLLLRLSLFCSIGARGMRESHFLLPHIGCCVQQFLWRRCGISGHDLLDNDHKRDPVPGSALGPAGFPESMLLDLLLSGASKCSVAWVILARPCVPSKQLLRLLMTLDQGRIGICCPGLSHHSSLPARVGSRLGFEGRSICFVGLAVVGQGCLLSLSGCDSRKTSSFPLDVTG